MDLESLDGILSRHDGLPADLIPVLQDLQDSYNYLPKDALKIVAARLQVPLTQIYSVATFYTMFSLVPKGKHICRVCLGTTCHLKGGQRLAESLSHRLGVDIGHTTQDMNFTLETVGCLGSCAQAPVLMIDATYYAKVTVDKVSKILKPYKKETLAAD
jgi:NADH-quinone oxidoreductase subunit E